MPTSTRKMTAKSGESSSSSQDHEKNDEGHEEQKGDNMGLSKNSTISSAKPSSSDSKRQQPSDQATTKVEEREGATESQYDEPATVPPTRTSLSSSSQGHTRAKTNPGGPISSSASRHTISSQSHLFSPPPISVKQSNQRRDYDQLDLNEAIMGEGMEVDDPLFTFDEEEGSLSRDFSRQPSEGNAVANSRKRGSSVLDHNPTFAKRSPISHPYQHYYPQEGSHSSALDLKSAGTKTARAGGGYSDDTVKSSGYHQGNADPSSTLRSGVSPAYPTYYGHSYQAFKHCESRTPSRGNSQHGAYYSGYSPYYRYYPDRTGTWDSRPYPLSVPGTPKITGPPYESDDEDSPPAPPSSPGGRSATAEGKISTPEKVLMKNVTRSPFRSPPLNTSWGGGSELRNNKAAFRPSPFFQASPGMIGNYGSFEMGTPSGVLASADFSPMGPSFELDEDSSIPFPLGEGIGSGNLLISRSSSNDDSEGTPSPTTGGRNRRRLRSPMSRYMSDMSPIDAPITMHGSTVRSTLHHDYHHQQQQISSARRYQHPPDVRNEGIDETKSISARKQPKANAVTMSGTRDELPSSRLDPGAKPKQLWPSSSDSATKERSSSTDGVTPGPVRLEIGGTGSLSTRKTLEGINNMIQPRQENNQNRSSSVERTDGVSGYSVTPGCSQSHLQQHYRPTSSHQSYPRGEMETPNKPYSHSISGPRSGGRHHQHHHPYRPPPGSSTKPMYPLKTDHRYSAGGLSKPSYMGNPPPQQVNSLVQHQSGIAPSVGKENGKKKAPPKSSPCNCKKSKCLKLYCECFAVERFCSGCNCTDCGNTPDAGAVRDKAIKDTRSKNSKAFQNRFVVKNLRGGNDSAQKVHSTGCKCKKSECLKKYCECFNAGVICGASCKCSDCLNYAGSQALIDKRRKIKDRPGADYALRISDERWKSRSGRSGRKAPPPAAVHRRQPPSILSPVVGIPQPPHHHHHMMHSSPRGPPPPPPPQGSHVYTRHPPPPLPHRHYMGPPPPNFGHGHPHHHHMGYPPMGMPVTPGYHGPPHHRIPRGERLHHGMYPPLPPRSNRRPPSSSARTTLPKMNQDNPKSTTISPRTPGVRIKFDPATSRKKRKVTPGVEEPTVPYFGPHNSGQKIPKQPKTTALSVFAFLSNDDLYHAGLVCHRWSKLAMDEELWKFQQK